MRDAEQADGYLVGAGSSRAGRTESGGKASAIAAAPIPTANEPACGPSVASETNRRSVPL
jgi:hypothetical protein